MILDCPGVSLEKRMTVFLLFSLYYRLWKCGKGKLGVKTAVFSENTFEFLSLKIFGKVKDVIFRLLKNTHFSDGFILSKEMVLLRSRKIIES